MTRSTKKIFIGLFSFFLLVWGCEEFLRRKIGGFAGSYPFVESWDLKVTEPELIEIIEEIKVENPGLQPPGDTSLTKSRHSYWLYINFYYTDTEERVHIWTRPNSDSTMTTLALVSFSEIDNPQERKLINRDFWYLANKLEISKFERLILEKIKERIRKRHASKS